MGHQVVEEVQAVEAAQGLSPDQIATAQANRAENGGGGGFRFNGAPAPLIEALVKFLQEKAGS